MLLALPAEAGSSFFTGPPAFTPVVSATSLKKGVTEFFGTSTNILLLCAFLQIFWQNLIFKSLCLKHCVNEVVFFETERSNTSSPYFEQCDFLCCEVSYFQGVGRVVVTPGPGAMVPFSEAASLPHASSSVLQENKTNLTVNVTQSQRWKGPYRDSGNSINVSSFQTQNVRLSFRGPGSSRLMHFHGNPSHAATGLTKDSRVTAVFIFILFTLGNSS